MIVFLQATASQEFWMGPFVDPADAVTAEDGLTIANTDIKFRFEGSTSAVSKTSGGATHRDTGWYTAVADATDTANLGGGTISCYVAGALRWHREFVILDANAYAVWTGTALQKVDLDQIKTDSQSATDLKDFADAGYDPGTNKVQGVVLVDTTTTTTTATNLTNAPTNGDLTATMKTSVTTAATAATPTVTAGTVSDKTGYRLSATGVDDILDEAVEGSRTFRQYLRGIAAALLGKSSNDGKTYRDVDDSKDRITATVDGDGNRTAITLDLT